MQKALQMEREKEEMYVKRVRVAIKVISSFNLKQFYEISLEHTICLSMSSDDASIGAETSNFGHFVWNKARF